MKSSKGMEQKMEKAAEVSKTFRPDAARRYPERASLYRPGSELPERAELLHEKGEKRRIFMTPRVEGFEASGVMSNEEVRQYLKSSFPEMHVNNITMEAVRYSDQYVGDTRTVELGHWEDRQVGERMNIYDKNIFINKQSHHGCDNVESMKETVAHEVGHQVYFVNLKNESYLKRDWDEISGDRSADRCVSDYARTNASEDFAETYLFFALYPNDLKRINPEKYDFMRRRVFSDS